MPKETNKKQNKEKKHFFKDFKAELKRVIWPTPNQLFNNTVAVITIVLLTSIIVFVLDFTLEKVNEFGIEKLKSIVETENSVVTDEHEGHDHEGHNHEETVETNEVSENTVNE